MTCLIRAAAVLAAMFLTVGTARAEAFQLSEPTHAAYQEYLKLIGSTRKGAFAAAEDGSGAYYIYCDDVNCLTTGMTQETLDKCRSLTGKDCVLLAVGRELRMEIAVVPARTALPSDSEILANVLPPERLKAYIIGNTMQGEYRNHRKWREYYAEDGTLRGKDDRLGAFRGRYDFKDDAVCYYYDGNSDWNWCARISILDSKVYLLEDDELVTNQFNTEWLQGNPHSR
jgi:hypothetical protein